MSKNLKKMLSLLCALALIVGMVVMPNSVAAAADEMPSEGNSGDNEIASDELVTPEEVPETYREVTFSDFGIKDYIVPGDAQVRKSLADAETLDGVAFTGYIQMQKQSDMYYTIRIGGKGADNAPDNEQWRGVGLWPEATNTISVYYYKTVVGGGYSVAQLPIADYGITYDAATNSYSEFKLRMTFDYIEGTSGVKLTVSLNDKLAVDTVLEDGQEYLGNRLHVWAAGGKTMGVKSISQETETYREVSFADFGIMDQKVPNNVQRTAALAGVENLDGIAVSGIVNMGFASGTLYHSIRIGANSNWGGVGLWTEATNQLALQYFTGPATNNGDIAKIKIADYGITYDAATNQFSPFKLRVAFDYVENTTDVKVKISVNDFVVYNGVLAGAQNHFANRVHIWGYGAPIGVASDYALETAENYYEVTFADCGISDQIIPNGYQPRGEIPGVENLDGVAFTGNLQMSMGSNVNAHSFRIGGSSASPFAGLGLRTLSAAQLSLAYYTGDVAQTELAVLDIADYGITYDAETGLYSDFKYRATFDFIDGTGDIYTTVYINDILAAKGILHDAQNVFGNNLWIWVSGTSIQVTSVEVPVNYKEVTFSDFGILDQTLPANGTQRIGVLEGAENLGNVAFTGMVQMGRVQHSYHSFRIGGKAGTAEENWSGIGVQTISGQNKLTLSLFTGTAAYEILAELPIADYGILYDSASQSFSAFKLRVTFQNIGAENVKVNISINGIQAYSGIIEGGQAIFGNRLHVWTMGQPITVASVSDTVVETPEKYREITFADLGMSDQLVTAQVDGKLTDAANFDGVAFSGKLEMGLSANIYHSFRIGGKDGDVDNNWSGLGLRTVSASKLELYYYTAHNGGKGALADIAIADYGITYDAETGLFSEFTLRTTFDYIDGTNDIYVTVTVNDKLVCEGALANAQDYFGNQVRVWANGGTIGIKSVIDKAADDVLDVYGISVTLHEAVSMNFHIAPEEIGDAEMQVIVGNFAPVAISAEKTDAYGNYIYVVELAAAQLTDTVTLQLVQDGETGNTYTTSGREYAEKLLAEEAYSDCHELVKFMLNYGAAAQVYFNYNADDLANSGYTVQEADVPADKPSADVSGNVAGVDFYGASLLFKSQIGVRFYFEVTGDVSGYTFLYGATVLNAKPNGSYYYVEISDINPQSYDEMIEVVVSDASGSKLTVGYSPMHYIKRKYNGDTTESLKALVKALYNYNLAAENYVGETDEKIASLVDFVVKAEEGREFRILQITDTQIIDPGQKRYEGRIEETGALTDEQLYNDCFYYIEEAVKQANPDLILLTGDLVYGEFDDNGTSLQRLIAYMESLNIPWAPIFGNHENESTKGVTWQCQQFEQAENCLFKRGDMTGNSNYTIGIQQGDKLIKVIYMMDTNGCWNAQSYPYMPEFGEYNQEEKVQITPGLGVDVIEWLDATSTEIANTLGYAPSKFAAVHIALTEFTAAAIAKGYQTGDDVTFTVNDPTGEDFGTQNAQSDRIPTADLWSIMKRQNFDGVFAGHEHRNNTSIVFEGIRLTFGLKTSVYDSYEEDMLGGTLITVAEGGTDFAVEHCYVEPLN